LSEAIVKLGLRLESLVDRSHELWQIQLQLMENLRTAGVRLWQPWSNEVSIETPVAEMPSAVEEMPRTSEAAPTLNNIESIDSSMDLEPGEINGCLFFDGEN
jgi:hypothetical protein